MKTPDLSSLNFKQVYNLATHLRAGNYRDDFGQLIQLGDAYHEGLLEKVREVIKKNPTVELPADALTRNAYVK